MCARILRSVDWVFQSADFRKTLALVTESDFVYADPPYAGRHVDYYNSWSEEDERDLVAGLKKVPCKFVLSTWYKNKYRTNPTVELEWNGDLFTINTIEHFYHVGPTESLRNSMTEALISNYHGVVEAKRKTHGAQLGLFDSLDAGSPGDGEIATPAEPDPATDRARPFRFPAA